MCIIIMYSRATPAKPLPNLLQPEMKQPFVMVSNRQPAMY